MAHDQLQRVPPPRGDRSASDRAHAAGERAQYVRRVTRRGSAGLHRRNAPVAVRALPFGNGRRQLPPVAGLVPRRGARRRARDGARLGPHARRFARAVGARLRRGESGAARGRVPGTQRRVRFRHAALGEAEGELVGRPRAACGRAAAGPAGARGVRAREGHVQHRVR